MFFITEKKKKKKKKRHHLDVLGIYLKQFYVIIMGTLKNNNVQMNKFETNLWNYQPL